MPEFRPGSFQILPTVIKNLLIINVLVYIAQITVGTANKLAFDSTFALHTWQSPYFKPWQFFTYMFMHGSPQHIISNMLALWLFGATLENLWGPKRFLTFYLVCGLGAALAHMIVLYFENQTMLTQLYSINSMETLQVFMQKYNKGYGQQITVEGAQLVTAYTINTATLGASGAVFGCLAAFGYLFPDEQIYFYLPIPIKAKWFVLGYIGIEFYLQFSNSAGGGIAHMAHLGGALIGFVMVYFWKKNNRRNNY